MKTYKIFASFKRGTLNVPKIELVENDYNAVELQFEFLDENDDSTKVLEIKKPNGNSFIADIKDNKVVLVDHDEKDNLIPVISQKGTYTFEVTKYTNDSKLTISQTGKLVARDEVVKVNDPQIEEDVRIPLLDTLIMETTQAKAYATEQGNYAKEQGDYAKEQANNVISASEEASEIIKNFEINVGSYTNAFNENAENKTTEFNTNATDKLKAYNTNSDTKVKEYNDNATSKVESFNENVETQTNTFNENVTEKLNAYNTNAETKLNEFNTNADSYNERITANENNIVDINNYMDAIVPKNDASGVPIYVDDALGYRLPKLNAKGNYKQETTQGINLFDISKVVSNGAVVNNNDGTLTVTSSSTSSSVMAAKPNTLKDFCPSLKVGDTVYLNATTTGTKAIYLLQSKYTWLFANPRTITQDDLDSIVYWYANGNNATVTISDIIISKENTNFEKYTGGQASPNPDYPQEIEVLEGDVSYEATGNNLFDISKVTSNNAVINNNDGTLTVIASSSSSSMAAGGLNELKNYCPNLKVGDTVYLNGNTTGTRAIYLLGSKFTWSFTKPRTITQEDLDSIVFWYAVKTNTTATVSDIMISKENIEYEPFQETKTSIDLKGNFVGKLPNGVADRLLYKDRHIYLKKNVGKIVLDGSEEGWEINGLSFQNRQLPNGLIGGNLITGISNYFSYSSEWGSSDATYRGKFNIGSTATRFMPTDENINTIEKWKTWLSTHNTTLYYQLATPELIDLGEYDLSTLEGVNNISLLANIEPTEMNMTYALDLKKYTDKKIAELSS